MKNKTLAAWLAFAGGPLGLHRLYLNGRRDTLAWLLPLPTLLGAYGIYRAHRWGLDDAPSTLLIPLLGFTWAGCNLQAIVYALSGAERWNARHNPGAPPTADAGRTGWLTVGAAVAALLVGATVLMASLAFSLQRLFEWSAR